MNYSTTTQVVAEIYDHEKIGGSSPLCSKKVVAPHFVDDDAYFVQRLCVDA